MNSNDHERPDENTPDVSAENPISDKWVFVGTHRPPVPRALVDYMTSQWEQITIDDGVHEAAGFCASRRTRLVQALEGHTLVIPTGSFKVRSNDTDFRFRPGSDFFWLTASHEPDGVLVILPSGEATLFIELGGDVSTHRFFTDAQYGELWTGRRPTLHETTQHLGLSTRPRSELADCLASLSGHVAVLRGFDRMVDNTIPPSDADDTLAHTLAHLRLTKDDYEVARLQEAVDATVLGFEDVVRALPSAIGRGERVIEGIFNLRARVEGNDVGYSTIAASGSHATVLHWTKNDGAVRLGELLLLDAGVECHDLYTADVTRTLPISGTFTDAQRTLYNLVLEAQEAGIAAVKPGAKFMDAHEAAMAVLAKGLVELGIIAEDGNGELPLAQLHRRYTLHGTSHMLGIDVHDCAAARNEHYLGELQPGYVLTVEPGLYFQANDLTVPEHFRGIGIRIEDDVLVTSDGNVVLSAGLPRDPAAIEAWMTEIWASGTPDLHL
ncbi:MAG: aminopeptidase P family protein [Actinomycetes bacterium]